MAGKVDDLIAFAAAHPWSPQQPPDTIQRFCTSLISTPERIIEIGGDGDRIAGVLIDRIDNPFRHAVLEIIGVDGEPLELIGQLIEVAAGQRPAGKLGFDVTLPATVATPDNWLAKHRLQPSYQGFDMVLMTMPTVATDTGIDARAKEYGEVYDVMAAAFAQNRDTHVPPREEWLGRRVAGASGTILIHREADKIVGYIHYSADGEDGDINTIGVLPAYRQRGIARGLLNAALVRLAQAGVTTCRLSAAAENEKALALYRDAGFAVE